MCIRDSCLQDLWGGESQLQTQGTWDPTVDLANNVAEVALQESTFPDPGGETLSAVPFQDVDGQAPREPAFQETGAADSSEDEANPKDLPAWTCSYVPTHTVFCMRPCRLVPAVSQLYSAYRLLALHAGTVASITPRWSHNAKSQVSGFAMGM